MIGIILLAASWALLKIQGRPLSVLGFNAPKQRSLEVLVGLIGASLFASAQFLFTAYFSNFTWVLNPDFSLATLLNSVRWNINSVLYEELIFRGYLLYKAIEFFGAKRACLISAASFGIYHWFSYGVWGDVVSMVYVFILTGMFGLMFAIAFAKTKSIFLPIALHLGWNFSTITIFSNGPLGSQLLIPNIASPEMLGGLEQLLITILIPLLLVILVITSLIKTGGYKSSVQ